MDLETKITMNLIHSPYWQIPVSEPTIKKALIRPPQLSYAYSALHSLYEAEELKYHFLNFHMKSFEDFLDNINGTMAEGIGMQLIFSHQDEFSSELIDNGCSVFNHQLFWDNLSTYGGQISPQLEKAIERRFGSVYKMKFNLIDKGMSQPNRGWLWLILDERNELQLITTEENQNPLLKYTPIHGKPILVVDLWDHAYPLKYSNQKECYLKTVWMLINWTEVSVRYKQAF